MRIKKTSGTTILTGNIINSLESDSQSNAPSINAVNKRFTYSTKGKEQIVGYWINGKPIYRKIIETSENSTSVSISTGISNMDWLIKASGVSKIKNQQIYLPLIFYNSGGWNNGE